MATDRTAFLEGERLYLRALQESDADGPYVGWLNDEAACQGNSHHVYPFSRGQALDYIRECGTGGGDLVLAIVLKAGDAHIGNIALQRINWIHRTAQFAILLGDRAQWGQGYGTEAARLIVRHGFTALNLNRIECGTYENNVGMRKLAAALAMKEEGARRQAVWKDGRYLDVLQFGVLRHEFEELSSRA
jgi:[ribosomal protein S5]-alanine N-acetyltransferase